MHDGVVRTLTEVCHILELKKNLVFVSSMNFRCFCCLVEVGVMHIKGKGKFVIILGTKQGNLYILQGSNVIGSVSIVS